MSEWKGWVTGQNRCSLVLVQVNWVGPEMIFPFFKNLYIYNHREKDHYKYYVNYSDINLIIRIK